MQKLKNNEARSKFTGSYKKKERVLRFNLCTLKVNEPDNNPYQEGWP